MRKYDHLMEYLSNQKVNSVNLPFMQVENIISSKLPICASKNDAWCRNMPIQGRQSNDWLLAGYIIADLNRQSKKVTFERTS